MRLARDDLQQGGVAGAGANWMGQTSNPWCPPPLLQVFFSLHMQSIACLQVQGCGNGEAG
jgi:hypothetical protein